MAVFMLATVFALAFGAACYCEMQQIQRIQAIADKLRGLEALIELELNERKRNL